MNDSLTDEKKELSITDLVRAEYKDHRLCTVIRTEENSYVLAVENPQSTGRNTLSQMHLTEESMLSLISCVFLFYQHNGINIIDRFQQLANSDQLKYEFASNREDELEKS